MSTTSKTKHVRLTKDGEVQQWVDKHVSYSGIVSSNQFFAIEDCLLYQSFDHNNKAFAGLSDSATRLYLLMLMRGSLKKNHVWSGPTDAKNLIGLNKTEYYLALEELEAKGFTKHVLCSNAKDHGAHCQDLLSAPYYDHKNGLYIKNPAPRTTRYHYTNTHFVIIPNQLVEDKWLYKNKTEGLSLAGLKVLMKLYEHNHLSIYGGVNPQKWHSSDSSNHTCPLLYEDIGMTKATFDKAMNGLIRKNLVKTVEVNLVHYPLMGQTTERYHSDSQHLYAPPGTKSMTILRPVYQVKSHVDKWLYDLQLRGVISNVDLLLGI
jgi:hypothetical protein